MTYNICLRGEGWGAEAALRSLQNNFDNISIWSPDADIQKMARARDLLIDAYCHEYDLVVCAGHKGIISQADLDSHEHLNVHYSLLPKYRGLHSVVWAILNNEPETGVTFHKMNAFIDDGDIVTQYKTPCNQQTALEVMNACHKIVETALGEDVRALLDGEISPTPQDKDAASWVTKRVREDCKIDFNQGVVYINNLIRALVAPYPLPYFSIKGHDCTLTRGCAIARPYISTNGKVVNIDSDGVWVKISDGLLLIQEVETNGVRIKANTLDLKIGNALND